MQLRDKVYYFKYVRRGHEGEENGKEAKCNLRACKHIVPGSCPMFCVSNHFFDFPTGIFSPEIRKSYHGGTVYLVCKLGGTKCIIQGGLGGWSGCRAFGLSNCTCYVYGHVM